MPGFCQTGVTAPPPWCRWPARLSPPTPGPAAFSAAVFVYLLLTYPAWLCAWRTDSPCQVRNTGQLGKEPPVSKEVALNAKMELAKLLATSDLLPRQYQNQPGNMLYAIEYAEALSVPPMTAVTGIHVIEGKPSASAQLIAALVRRAGHKLRVSCSGGVATATVVRADDPEFTFTSEWTMERASNAGLTGKAVWKKFPEAMLKARAITEVARDAASEALFGIIYTAEELGATEVDQDGAFVGQTTVTVERAPVAPADPFRVVPVAPVAQTRDWVEDADALTGRDALLALYQDAKAAGAPADVLAHIVECGKRAAEASTEPVDAEVVAPITAAQVKAIQTVAGRLFPDRDARLERVSELVGRTVGSVKDLDTDEAAEVLAVFKTAAAEAAAEYEVSDEDPFAPTADPVADVADAGEWAV